MKGIKIKDLRPQQKEELGSFDPSQIYEECNQASCGEDYITNQEGSLTVLMNSGRRLRKETKEKKGNRTEKSCIIQRLANAYQAQSRSENLQLD